MPTFSPRISLLRRQSSEFFASKLKDASLAAIIFTLIWNFVVQWYFFLCKALWERLLLSPKKRSEGTSYSVPSFGGRIAISHDVTRYPFLIMARTWLNQSDYSICISIPVEFYWCLIVCDYLRSGIFNLFSTELQRLWLRKPVLYLWKVWVFMIIHSFYLTYISLFTEGREVL